MENKLSYQQLEAKFIEIQALNIKLTSENEDLKKEQKEFQDVLILKVKEIQASPKGWRWLKYGKLLTDLIDTILEAIKKANNK